MKNDVVNSGRMLIGYFTARKNALRERRMLIDAGVSAGQIYEDSVINGEAPEFNACLKALRAGDVLVLVRLTDVALHLHQLLAFIDFLSNRSISLRVLSGPGSGIDTSEEGTHIEFFVRALLDFEQEILSLYGPKPPVKPRGRGGGRKPKMTVEKIKRAQAVLQTPGASVKELARDLGVCKQTIYRYFDSQGGPRKNFDL